MFNRGCSVCCWWGGHGEVVEIFEGIGIRRAKVMAAGELVEIAALGGGEIHLGDRIDLAWPRSVASDAPRASLDGSDVLGGDDGDPFPEW
jgi:hypothetical protein